MKRRGRSHLPAMTHERTCPCSRLEALKGKVRPYAWRVAVFITTTAAGVGFEELLKRLWHLMARLF